MKAIINGKVEFDSEVYLMSLVDSPELYIKLQPITCLVLTELLSRNGTIISREELLEYIWVGRGYSPSNASLNNNIAAIRKSYLNLTGEELSLITLPKQGYEFKCDLDIKQDSSLDYVIKDESTKKNKSIKKIFNSMVLLALALVVVLFILLSITQPFEFKPKKYSEIHSLGSCFFYVYNFSGTITEADKIVSEQFANEKCFEKNAISRDVFVDLNTQNTKYTFITACKKDMDGVYTTCANYKTTYTLN
ncbi:winged helix-turn-helix domain-containing protein [Enterobacter roggenkampii]